MTNYLMPDTGWMRMAEANMPKKNKAQNKIENHFFLCLIEMQNQQNLEQRYQM
jgi:hypothetical protein